MDNPEAYRLYTNEHSMMSPLQLRRTDTGETLFLSIGTNTLGRSPQCQVTLEDPSVSNRHALILCESGNRYTLRDLGSTNGTFLDGARIKEAKLLKAGQRLQIGSIALELLIDESALPANPVQVPRQPTRADAEPKRPSRKAILVWAAVAVASLSLLLLFVAVITITGKDASRKGHASQTAHVEDFLRGPIEMTLNKQKQSIFDRLHPVGTAKSVVVHDVTVTAWKHGQDTNRPEDILQINVRYTLYWEGPVNKDGFTKINEVFDMESRRCISGNVIATNGITYDDATKAAGALLGTWLQYEAEKAGAENAARDYLGQ